MSQITKLYHYSVGKYDAIKTRAIQGITDNRNDNVKSDYNETMSFFFEHAPLDILGSIFGPTHHTWVPGTILYEYEILINNTPDFTYRIVESPEKTALYYKWWYEDNLPDSTYNKYKEELEKIEKNKGYIGKNKKEFIKATSPLVGLTREFYLKLPTRPN
jgi:hypothetical protein